ncbi:hypothetical protein L1049_009867 [Liquidambar formosana]|uniref:Peptidase C19 ubiquitin carboxyl-terminal hydrolase domain-containing protein n=1 Tax=Liquidambar formosana TaxID=63359 RepID=A0AAP0N8S4_LIQFO
MEEGDFFFMDRKFFLHFIGRLFVLYFMVNFPVKNLKLKDYIPLLTLKENEKLRSKYDLIANIVHDGKPGEGVYRVFVQRKYEMQDLHVSETLPQMVALSEAYMQVGFDMALPMATLICNHHRRPLDH